LEDLNRRPQQEWRAKLAVSRTAGAKRKRQGPRGLWRFPGASYLFGQNTIRPCRAMNLQQNPNPASL
jgi:hypothetical protein